MTSEPPFPARRRRQAEQREQTTTRILDHAEMLFARHGLHGTTLKQVAKSAGVDPALLHHYFGDKQQLFDAVFGRRAVIANRVRTEAMDRYAEAAGDALTAEGVIDAFLTPTFELVMESDPGWRNYAVLVAQVNNTPEWGGETMRLHFDPLIQRLIALLRQIAPELSDADLYWFYHCLSGALTLTLAQTGRIDRLSSGLCRSDDMAAIRQRIIPLFAGGFERLRAERREAPGPETGA
ncbi:TetR/AcrR family transcriptional regulator [Sphingomonas sp. DT-204]|uniref:TetR/AcrR family transcriptional regulator n=1 Tax=Sphingomonas sp. DT-204 TaxID=3396166 RepID=UPI003F1984E1